jgi:rSAM/selenodomain-associated transferase 1
MAEPLIILFARAPRLGGVKRRLAAGIGDVAALRFHRNQLARILRELRGFNAVIAITPDRAKFRPPPGIPLINQGHGDLGARMSRAFRRYPKCPVILIGADIPDLSAAHLRQAAKFLRHHDAVFGPATDGGYYLMAMSARRPSAPFANVRWSTEHAMADTEKNFRRLRIAKLPVLSDIDTEENLKNHLHSKHCRAARKPVTLRVVGPSDLAETAPKTLAILHKETST